MREIEFDRSYKDNNEIGREQIDSIKDLLQNVKVVRAINCDFFDGCGDYLIDCCKNVKSVAIKIHKNLQKNRFHLQRHSNIKNIEINFDRNANVAEAMSMLKMYAGRIFFDELVLIFLREHYIYLSKALSDLNEMYDKQFYKQLYLSFESRTMLSKQTERIATVKGLEGVTCAYTLRCEGDIHLSDIAKLQNIKYLYLNWLLCSADGIAQSLEQLEEAGFSYSSIDAIISFARYSRKLTKLHLDTIRSYHERNIKFNTSILQKERLQLECARKLFIYLPEKKFLNLKWSGAGQTEELIEIKREESYMPKCHKM